MTPTEGDARPLLVVVGGCGGLVGRAVLEEFRRSHRIRSVHRSPVPAEASAGVEWVRADAGRLADWAPIVDGADTVLATAWYRQAPERRFVELAGGLRRLVRAAEGAGVRRFAHLSVPPAPERLEATLPYLREKRSVDAAIQASSLRYAIVRPTMLFGDGDVLLTVLLRLARKYHRLPMFGDGRFHVSPLAVPDLARILRREMELGRRESVLAGGPERFAYRELLDLLFGALGREPRYLRLSPLGAVRLARLLELLRSTLVYAYEVEWLLSDALGLAPYVGLETPLLRVAPFVRDWAEASGSTRARAGRSRAAPPPPR